MPEVRVRRAGRDNQVVVRHRALVERHRARRGVDGARLGEQHANVALPAEYPSDWRRDVSRRQPRGGDLVEEGLKQVVVPAVEQGNTDRRAFERLRCREAAETAADDQDMGWV